MLGPVRGAEVLSHRLYPLPLQQLHLIFLTNTSYFIIKCFLRGKNSLFPHIMSMKLPKKSCGVVERSVG